MAWCTASKATKALNANQALEQLVQRALHNTVVDDAVEQKRFMLQAYFKGDEETLKFDQFYYNSMGITVIGYEKDEKGYNQIYEVIKNWNTEIRQTSTYLLDSFQEIEEIVGDL